MTENPVPIFDPAVAPEIDPAKPAPRGGGLEGKRVGTLWNGKVGGDKLMRFVLEELRAGGGGSPPRHRAPEGHRHPAREAGDLRRDRAGVRFCPHLARGLRLLLVVQCARRNRDGKAGRPRGGHLHRALPPDGRVRRQNPGDGGLSGGLHSAPGGQPPGGGPPRPRARGRARCEKPAHGMTGGGGGPPPPPAPPRHGAHHSDYRQR